nr:Exoribonuclease domain containing protein [Haemonchus contortus]
MPFVKTDFSISLGELKHHFTPSRRQEPGGDIFRPVCFKCRVFDGPPGSAYAEFGGTKVLARVYGPIDDPNGYSNAASLSVKMKGLSNTTRIASQVLSVVKTCVMVHKYSQCLFDIEVTVLNDEGGLLQCALMATTLALADAEVLLRIMHTCCNAQSKSDSLLRSARVTSYKLTSR